MMSACHAIEDALGIRVTGQLRALRRLLYSGEWIESHGLHVFLLHAPDFLGYPDAMAMAKDHGEWVKKGLRIKKAGNTIVEVLGGRAIHPVNVRVGGFYRAPASNELEALLPELRWGREACAESLIWMAGSPFRRWSATTSSWRSGIRASTRFVKGAGLSKGLAIELREYDAYFAEEQVPHSNALHSRIRGRGAYLCGPLARFNLNFDRLHPEVQRVAAKIGRPACRNPFKNILVRLLEMTQAFEEAIRLIENYESPPTRRRGRAARGVRLRRNRGASRLPLPPL